jgi:hypothetical protein
MRLTTDGKYLVCECAGLGQIVRAGPFSAARVLLRPPVGLFRLHRGLGVLNGGGDLTLYGALAVTTCHVYLR